eukprot:s4980_g2.t1
MASFRGRDIRSGSLDLEDCADSAEQLLDGNLVTSAFYDKYKAENQAEVDSTPVSNAKTLFDVNGDLDCEADAVSRVLQKIMFTRTRISGICVLATTATQKPLKSLSLSFQLVNSRWQKCIAAVPCQQDTQGSAGCIGQLQECEGREDQAFKIDTQGGLEFLQNRARPGDVPGMAGLHHSLWGQGRRALSCSHSFLRRRKWPHL